MTVYRAGGRPDRGRQGRQKGSGFVVCGLFRAKPVTSDTCLSRPAFCRCQFPCRLAAMARSSFAVSRSFSRPIASLAWIRSASEITR